VSVTKRRFKWGQKANVSAVWTGERSFLRPPSFDGFRPDVAASRAAQLKSAGAAYLPATPRWPSALYFWDRQLRREERERGENDPATYQERIRYYSVLWQEVGQHEVADLIHEENEIRKSRLKIFRARNRLNRANGDKPISSNTQQNTQSTLRK
jgi:hypothetical protein